MPVLSTNVSFKTHDTVDELRRSFNPTMTKSEILRWMISYVSGAMFLSFKEYVEEEQKAGKSLPPLER